MKKFLFTALITLFAGFASAAVTITNLAVAQRPGTKLVDITYDVSSTATNVVLVGLAVSNGVDVVSATNLTGDVGESVATGTAKSIVWNMTTDWNANAATLSFSVWAYDGVPDCPVPNTSQHSVDLGVAWPNPRFADLNDGTVKDLLTGLEWVQSPPYSLPGYSAMVWTNAIDFCNNLVYAGHSDWRLPSRKELMSLVDYGRYSPALPAGHPFAGVKHDYYWSGTSYTYWSGYAWYVDMDVGYVQAARADVSYYVWPVRGGQ